MKKIFTLIAMALMAISANAYEVTLWEGEALVTGWGNQPSFLADGGDDLTENNAQAGDIIRFYASAPDDNWQVELFEGHWKGMYERFSAKQLYEESGDPRESTIVDLAAQGYFEFTLTDAMLEAAVVKGGWGGVFLLNGDGDLTVTKMTLVKEGEAPVIEPTVDVSLNITDGQHVLASEFDAYADDWKVQVIVTVQAIETDYGKVGPGWGIGKMITINQWNDDAYKEFSCKAASDEGEENVFEMTVGDLKACAKKGGDTYFTDEYGLQGVTFGFYNGATLKEVKICVPESLSVNAVKVAKNANTPIYNLAGQQVNKAVKGVYIQNGKKFIVK